MSSACTFHVFVCMCVLDGSCGITRVVYVISLYLSLSLSLSLTHSELHILGTIGSCHPLLASKGESPQCCGVRAESTSLLPSVS